MNKFERAKTAVAAGADIVIELPTAFATNGADEFAFGAVKIMDALGVDEIVFGSECGDITALEKLADFQLNEPPQFKTKLQQNLSSGVNFMQAYQSAMSDITSDKTLQKLASSPNDILGAAYIKAAKKQNSKIKFSCIKRTDNGFNAGLPKENHLSASSILELEKNGKDVSSFVPNFTWTSMTSAPIFDEKIYHALLAFETNKKTPLDLSQILGMTEGLEFAIKKTLLKSETLETAVNNLTSKRYRKSRIQRLLLHVLLGLTKFDYEAIKNNTPAVKVLAVKKEKKDTLKILCTRARISLILKNSDYDTLTPAQKISASLDISASDLYSVCTHTPLSTDKTIGTLYL